MRSTVRIDDDLMIELKRLAREENVSLTRMFNRVLRNGLGRTEGTQQPYREEPVPMGKPTLDLTKARSLAAELEDEEILRKLALKK